MKLIIPPEVQIGALLYHLFRNDYLLEKINLSGHISSKDQKIWIAHREIDQEFLVLVHEACHGICDELGIASGEESENFIKALATGVALFILSLGIEPDFSQIPEEKS